MSWGEIRKAVNSDLNVPLNHLIWLNDYKTYGEDSYVFARKDILHELYRDYRITINDKKIRKEAMLYAESIGETGLALAQQYDCDLPSVAEYSTFDEINQNGNIRFLEETYLDNGKLRWLFDAGILTSTFYIASNVNMLIKECSVENFGNFIDSNAVTIWYNDPGIYDEITKGVDVAIRLYNIGGRIWSKCSNQTYYKAIYDYESTKGNVRTIVGYTSGSANTQNNLGKLTNTKALLAMAVEQGTTTGFWGAYIRAKATNGEEVVEGSFAHEGNLTNYFGTDANGFMYQGRPQIIYGFYPCDSVEVIAKTYSSYKGTKVIVSAV